MADNIAITPGTGATVAADDIGGVHHQRIKLSLGADGSAADALGGAGAVASGVQRVTLASDDPGVAHLATIAGAVSPGPVPTSSVSAVFDFTPSCHTGANTAGDIVAATEALSSICRANDACVTLVSLFLVDAADQKAALDVWFFDANTSIGTEDAAPDIDDTEVLTMQGRVNIEATDYYDLGGASVAQVVLDQPIVLKPASGTDDIYMAVTTTGTPTYGASSLKFRLGLYKD